MRDNIVFANAVAKSKENTLFSEERLSRMMDAATLQDAVKILIEANYGGGAVPDSPGDFEKILEAEQNLLVKFIDSIRIREAGFDCFFLQADYHNAKALLKAKYQGIDPSPMLTGGGLIPVNDLKEKLSSEETYINPYMDKAVKEIRKAFESGKSPRTIDVVLDREMYRDITDRLSSSGTDESIRRYFTAYIDCLNISTFVRSARIGAKMSFFTSNFLDGGAVNMKNFTDRYPDVGKLTEFLKFTDYRRFVETIEPDDLSAFDTARDDFLLGIFRENRYDMFSVAPAAGYYAAKRNEMKVIRMVLVCIKNGVDRSEIKKRLRAMYA